NGMIGSALSDFLYFLNEVYNYNINIIAIVRSIEKSRNRFFYSDNHRINIYEFDVIDNSFIDLIMKKHDKIHYIIHAASNANPLLYSTDPVGTSVTNIIGMKNVLELAHKF